MASIIDELRPRGRQWRRRHGRRSGVAQHTKTVGWVPEDEEATMKREVGDEVGSHWPEGPRVVTKVTRPYMDRDGPAVTLRCDGCQGAPAGRCGVGY